MQFKKLLLISSAALSLGTAVTPLITSVDTVFAEETSTVKQHQGNSAKLQSLITDYAVVEKEGDKGTITLSDADLLAALYKSGYDVPSVMPYSDGKTTVKVYSWSNGNADIFLSKGFINGLIGGGAGAVGGALAALLPGAGWGAAIGAISGIIASQSVSSGKVFEIRGFKYVGSHNQ